MRHPRNIRDKFILLLVLTAFILPSMQCKKNSTTPDMNLLTLPIIWQNYFNLSFVAFETAANPAPQILQIKNSGLATLDYTLTTDADWVHVSPENGTSTGQIVEHTISVDKSGLPVQNEDYTATISITCSQAYNNPQSITVNLKISDEAPPEIWTNTQQLSFLGQESSSNPPSQTLIIKNTGKAALNYNIIENIDWLSITPTSGTVSTGSRSHNVSVDISGMKAGVHNGTITISDPDATNNPQKIKVTLNLSDEPLPEPPPPSEPPPTPPPSPPSTDNEVKLSINPDQGGTGTIVTLTVSIDGNLSPISTFGFELNYDPAFFQYKSTSKGTLTNSWLWVEGNAASGKITVGGLTVTAEDIPSGSTGSIAIVKLKVIHTGTSDQSTQITMGSLTDDLAGMTIKPAAVTFTYKN